MDQKSGTPSCFSYLLIILGIVIAIGAALLLSQFDALQQRSLLPQATLPVVDLEATLAAGDLPVIVITGVASQGDISVPTSTRLPPTSIQATITVSPVVSTSEESALPPCSITPEDWIPYLVKESDTLRSLAIRLRIEEDTIASANCLIQPQLESGQIIYLPHSAEFKND